MPILRKNDGSPIDVTRQTVIHKHVVDLDKVANDGRYSFSGPASAIILSAKEQGGQLCVWYERLVEDSNEDAIRVLWIFPTGGPRPTFHNHRFIDTVLLQDGALVLHVYA